MGRGRCTVGDCGGTLYCNGGHAHGRALDAGLLRREPGGWEQHPHRHGAIPRERAPNAYPLGALATSTACASQPTDFY
jgi:hypothetical protein